MKLSGGFNCIVGRLTELRLMFELDSTTIGIYGHRTKLHPTFANDDSLSRYNSNLDFSPSNRVKKRDWLHVPWPDSILKPFRNQFSSGVSENSVQQYKIGDRIMNFASKYYVRYSLTFKALFIVRHCQLDISHLDDSY